MDKGVGGAEAKTTGEWGGGRGKGGHIKRYQCENQIALRAGEENSGREKELMTEAGKKKHSSEKKKAVQATWGGEKRGTWHRSYKWANAALKKGKLVYEKGEKGRA